MPSDRRHRGKRPGPPRKRGKAPDPLIGGAWYQEAEYERRLAAAKDRETLENTWADWKRGADEVVRRCSARGMEVRRVEVKRDELLA